MKYREVYLVVLAEVVTLYVRVWIEILGSKSPRNRRRVTLYVRVWIEIDTNWTLSDFQFVTLYVRVWIEIPLS